jgi:hypothetical protein
MARYLLEVDCVYGLHNTISSRHGEAGQQAHPDHRRPSGAGDESGEEPVPGRWFTKAQVIDYYIRVSPYLLPHLKDRPVTLKRYPDGVTGEHFYEKDAPSFTLRIPGKFDAYGVTFIGMDVQTGIEKQWRPILFQESDIAGGVKREYRVRARHDLSRVRPSRKTRTAESLVVTTLLCLCRQL